MSRLKTFISLLKYSVILTLFLCISMSVTFNSIAMDKKDPWEQPPRLLTSELPIDGNAKKPKKTKNATNEYRRKTVIKRHVEKVEKKFVNDLKNKYPLGYALFYVDKDSWYYEPKNVGLKVDWSASRITSISKDQITILLPDYVDKNNNTFSMNRVTFPRLTGANAAPFRIGSIELVVECLDSSEKNTTIAVGFRNANNLVH